ncbi:MAG: hypothetical protein ACT4P3_18920 [Betaproteobacteria bacterium]
MSFERWLKEGRLKRQKPARQEIAGLAELADRRLADSRTAGVSAEGRFMLAYNAALALATAALRAEGYRTSSNLPGHHAVTLASLAFTIRADAGAVAALDAWRKKRHRTTYDAAEVSEHELRELIALVEKLKDDFSAWLQTAHAELAAGLRKAR